MALTKLLSIEGAPHNILVNEESDKLLDNDQLVQEAIHAVEQNGIVFLDEIDKICVRDGRSGGDVSREGVQRDLLPIVEGSNVQTKYGMVKTDHVLFIAAGFPLSLGRFGKIPMHDARFMGGFQAGADNRRDAHDGPLLPFDAAGQAGDKQLGRRRS